MKAIWIIVKGENSMLKGEELKELIKLIDESSITEFKYEKDDSSVTIKKQVEVNQIQVPVNVPQVAPVTQIGASEAVQQAATTEEVVKQTDENIVEIVAPMVGTFYRKPSPESDPYVDIGSKVTDTSIVCILEAMKLFNEIEAEVTGEIVEVLVGDGELVEYGQPLFTVKKN